MKPIFVIFGALLIVAGLVVAGSGLPLSVTGNTLTVKVTVDGAPLAGASIRVTTPEGTMMTGKTGGTGARQFTGLVQGLYTVAVSTDKFGSATRRAYVGASSLTTLTIDLDGPPQDNPVTFTPTKVSGFVYSQLTNTPLSGAKVVAGSLTATSDANGAYLLTFTAAYTGKVYAEHNGYKSVEKSMTITEGLAIREDFQVQNGYATITVNILDAATGDKVKLPLAVDMGQLKASTSTGVKVFTNVNYGFYWLKVYDPSSEAILGRPSIVAYGDYVTINAPTHTFNIRVTVNPPPEEEPVDLPDESGKCAFTVLVGGTDDPIYNAEISFKKSDGTTYKFYTGQDGVLNQDFAPGTYTVAVSAVGFVTETGSVIISAGETESRVYELDSTTFDDSDDDPGNDYPDDETAAALTFSDYFASIALIITGLIVLLYGIRRT